MLALANQVALIGRASSTKFAPLASTWTTLDPLYHQDQTQLLHLVILVPAYRLLLDHYHALLGNS